MPYSPAGLRHASRARPVTTSVPTPFSRLARRRGQLDAVSTRVPTPGNASVDGGVVLPREVHDRAGDTLPGNVQNSRVHSEREKGKSARTEEREKGIYARIWRAVSYSCQYNATLSSRGNNPRWNY